MRPPGEKIGTGGGQGAAQDAGGEAFARASAVAVFARVVPPNVQQ
jgi:hypothetical protein